MRLFIGGLLVALLLPGGEASAFCAPREKMLQDLENDYRERPVSIGLDDGGNVVEVLASKNGVTFTIIFTRPDGMSCTLSTGENWERIKPLAEGEET